jgi:hypothetical protein
MNILRGNALTNPNGLVLDVFHFTDDEHFLEKNPTRPADVERAGRRRRRPRRRRGALRGRERGVQSKSSIRFPPVVGPATRRRAATRFSTSSRRTRWACCYRISRVIAEHRCDVDLVLIATEGARHRRFHLTLRGAKLTEAEQLALTSDLQRTLEEIR